MSLSLRASPLFAAGAAVAVALVVAATWFARSRAPVVESARDGTVSVRIARHDAYGVPGKPVVVRDRAHVRALVEALGVDGQRDIACVPDYASAEIGLVLSGHDVYTKRNVYVWDLVGDGGSAAPHVLVVTTAGCRGGMVPDRGRLVRELDDAGVPR